MKYLFELAVLKKPKKHQFIKDYKNKKIIKRMKKNILELTHSDDVKNLVDLTIEYIHMCSFIKQSDIFPQWLLANDKRYDSVYLSYYFTECFIDEFNETVSCITQHNIFGYYDRMLVYASKKDKSVTIKVEDENGNRSHEITIIDNPLVQNKELSNVDSQIRYALESKIRTTIIGIIDCYYEVYLRR